MIKDLQEICLTDTASRPSALVGIWVVRKVGMAHDCNLLVIITVHVAIAHVLYSKHQA